MDEGADSSRSALTEVSARRSSVGSMTTPAARAASALDTVLDKLVVPGYSKLGPAIRRRLPTWPADPTPGALAGEEVLVTGASSGLGLRAVEDLVALGARVHVIVRNEDKGREALAGAGLTDHTTLWRCDLGDLEDIRALATTLQQQGVVLRALVHNAGLMPPERTESPQGHEMTMAVHLLGPLLLTELLLARLEVGARVVFMTSGGMYAQTLRADDPEYLDGDYSPTTAYARSKRAQVELVPALGARWRSRGVEVYAVHPGWAATPGVTDSLPGFDKVVGPLLRDAETGVDTVVWLVATEPTPPAGLWHDRRERPSTWFGVRATTQQDRKAMLAWALDATDLPALPPVPATD